MEAEPVAQIGVCFYDAPKSCVADLPLAVARLVVVNNVNHARKGGILLHNRADRRGQLLAERLGSLPTGHLYGSRLLTTGQRASGGM